MKVTVQATIIGRGTSVLECSECHILCCCANDEANRLMQEHLKWHGATIIKE